MHLVAQASLPYIMMTIADNQPEDHPCLMPIED
jgi:hypothetical protein